MKLAGKKDIIIIAAALAVCAVAMLFFGRGKGGDTVRVYLDDELYEEASLYDDCVITVQQSGAINEVHIKNGSVYMGFSTCDNQLCIHQGEVTPENAEKRPLGSWIICLPNRVTVELVQEGAQ